MRKVCIWLSLALALPLYAQTINPNQIRPATSNGQVLTTVTANQPPSWQAAADTATAEGVAPCTVNSVSGSFESAPFTIFCPGSNFQPSTPDPNGTQSTLIYFTPSSGVAQGPGNPGLTFTFPGLPSCVSAVNVTDAYIYVTSSGYVPNGLPTDFSVFNSGGGTTTNIGPGQFIPPGGGSGGVGGQPQWSTSTVGTHFTVLPTNYTAVTVGLTTSSLSSFSSVAVTNVVMRVYYTGTACPAQAAINLNPPIGFDPVHQAIFLSSPFGNAIDFGAVNVYTANVSLLDSTNGGHPVPGDSVKLFVSNANTSTTPTLAITNSSDTVGRTIVNAPPTGSSTTTALSVGQLQVGIPYTLTLDQAGKWEIDGGSSSGITALTGDVLASGTGSVAATVKGLNGVPFCTGYTPTNGQAVTLTTASSPNPCYTAVTGSGSVTDGGGTTTPNQIATSTSTAHQIQYGTVVPNGTTATTQTTGDNTTKVATDAFVLANAAGAGCSGATCVQYNPTSTANIFLSFSGLYDDNHAISGTVIPVTSVATSGSVTTVTTTSAHGLIAGNAVEVDTITGWPCAGQSAQCGSFQIISTGLTSTQFEFNNNGHTLTCSSSCGNVWNASFWAIWETASQPFFSGHGTVYGVEQTLATVAGAFGTYVNCSLGTPTYLIIEGGQDDLGGGASAATIKGYLGTIWQAAHAAGCIVAQGTLTGADYGGSPLSSVFTGMEVLNVWIPTQAATPTSNGSNWDIAIDYGLFLGTRGGGNYTLGETEAASRQFAIYTNQALANQSGNMTGPPPIAGQGDRSTGVLHYDAAYGQQYWNDGNNLFWMQWGTGGNNGNYVGIQNNYPSNGASLELMQNGNVGEFNHACIGSNALANGPLTFSNGNAFCWNFNYVSSGSNSNYMGLGPIRGTDNIRFYPNGDAQFPALTGLPGSGTSVVCVDPSGYLVVGGCAGSGLNGTVTYTSSQTASSGDNGKLVIMNCGSACAYTLPGTQPSTTWQISIQTIGSTTATIALGGGDTYNGSASVPVLQKFSALPIWANTATSTDYRGGTPPVAGTNVTLTPASNGQTIASAGSSGGGTSGWSGAPITFISSTTQYAPWVGGAATSTTEALVENASPATSTISNLQVNFSASLGAGTTLAVTLRDGASSTALTCTTSSGGTSCSDLSHVVNVTQGDELDFLLVASGTVTAGLPQIVISYAIGAPTGNVVTSATPGTNVTCTPLVGGKCIGDITLNATGGGSGLFSGVLSAIPTTTSTGFTTAYNQQGTFTSANNPTGLTIADSASGGLIEGVVKAYPATPFTAIMLISPNYYNVGSATRFGFVVANTTTGANMLFNMGFSGGNPVPTVIGSTDPNFGSFSFITTGSSLQSWPIYLWLKYVDDGTNITFSLSTDASNYSQIYTVSRASSYLGSSGFNFFGFVLSPSGAPMSATLLSYQD